MPRNSQPAIINLITFSHLNAKSCKVAGNSGVTEGIQHSN